MAVCVGHPLPVSQSKIPRTTTRCKSSLQACVYKKKSYRYSDNIIIESFDMSPSSFSNPHREHIIYCYYYYYFFQYLIFLMSYSRARRLLSSRICVYYGWWGKRRLITVCRRRRPECTTSLRRVGAIYPLAPPHARLLEIPPTTKIRVLKVDFPQKKNLCICNTAQASGRRRRIYWFWPVGI